MHKPVVLVPIPPMIRAPLRPRARVLPVIVAKRPPVPKEPR